MIDFRSERVRSDVLWMGCIAIGFTLGRWVRQAIGESWPLGGQPFPRWMFDRLLSHHANPAEVAGFLWLFYGSVALSGMLAAMAATYGRMFGARAPFALIAAVAAALHALVVSPAGAAIGAGAAFGVSVLAILVAAAFGWLWGRAIGPPPAGRCWPKIR